MSLIAHYERVCVHMSEEWSCSRVCLWECDDYEAHRDVPCVFAQLEQLQAELTADRESLRSAESLSADLLKEKAQLEKTLETLQENSDRQVNFIHAEDMLYCCVVSDWQRNSFYYEFFLSSRQNHWFLYSKNQMSQLPSGRTFIKLIIMWVWHVRFYQL